ncbi:MAG TPA: hypothetical protein VFY18_10695 [Candidatus Limnocylindrales bacterium]|nr:hypothetical protein [Candidatus Limnocylindrales bacterium]
MIRVHLPTDLTLSAFAAVGIVIGLILLARGFGGFRAARRISGTSTSRISALAVGEVLVSGPAEALELTLVSPLQSAPCLYYRARVREASDGDGRDIFTEERAVGFRVRDTTGAVRVFPRGARFDVPDRFDGTSGSWDGDPPGLMPRIGSAFGPGPDRESQIAALLTVRDPGGDPWGHYDTRGAPTVLGNSGSVLAAGGGRRHYQEARIDPGEVVTVIGQVLPFGELDDPASANVVNGSADPASDPEIAADLAEAREAGILADSPAEAWGNAAIEGFGIGHPVRAPVLDPAATPPPPPDPEIAARVAATFEIAPGDLVIAASDEVPLIVSLGAPATAAARHQLQFIVGLLGAVLSIGSAMALALVLDGTIR